MVPPEEELPVEVGRLDGVQINLRGSRASISCASLSQLLPCLLVDGGGAHGMQVLRFCACSLMKHSREVLGMEQQAHPQVLLPCCGVHHPCESRLHSSGITYHVDVLETRQYQGLQ